MGLFSKKKPVIKYCIQWELKNPRDDSENNKGYLYSDTEFDSEDAAHRAAIRFVRECGNIFLIEDDGFRRDWKIIGFRAVNTNEKNV